MGRDRKHEKPLEQWWADKLKEWADRDVLAPNGNLKIGRQHAKHPSRFRNFTAPEILCIIKRLST